MHADVSGASLISIELFERGNQNVACPIIRAAYWRPSACVDANWWELPYMISTGRIQTLLTCAKAQERRAMLLLYLLANITKI